MPLIKYNTGRLPDETGVYACRIPIDGCKDLSEDMFLMWLGGRWGYLRSDQKYRGDVLGWLGPLQRRLTPNVGNERLPKAVRSIDGLGFALPRNHN